MIVVKKLNRQDNFNMTIIVLLISYLSLAVVEVYYW